MKTIQFILALPLALACTRAPEASPAGATRAAAEPIAKAASADGPESITAPIAEYATAAAEVKKGEELFATKGCVACHKLGGGKLVGPDLKGVTARRSIKWLQRMILKPDVMLREDPTAKDLLRTYMTPMPAQGVNPDTELAALLAFLKANEK